MYLTIETDANTGRAEILRHEGTPSYDRMTEVVGGYICTAGRALGDTDDRRLTVWCDDEALIKSPAPPNVANIGHTLRTDAPYLMLGNLLVTASDAAGNTVPMTETEASRVMLNRKSQGAPSLDIVPR